MNPQENIQPPDSPVADAFATTQQLPPKKFGPYDIVEQIGAGGMAVVYKAYHPQLDRTVAIKVMTISGQSERERNRLLTEAKLTAKLKHPNIVSVHDVGTLEGIHYLVMDFIDGKTLQEVIREGRLSTRKALEIMKELAFAVDYAHKNGIIHRDLKPGNVMIEKGTGRPLLLDFGLAKNLQGDKKNSMTKDLLGTPRYVAPEQAARSRKVTPLIDVYALGTILYEMVAGVPAVGGTKTLEILYNVVNCKVVSPRNYNPGITRDMETVCLKALNKDPNRRYPSAKAFGEDLERILAGQPIWARPTSLWYKIWLTIEQNKATTGAITALSLLLLAASFWAWHTQKLLSDMQQQKKQPLPTQTTPNIQTTPPTELADKKQSKEDGAAPRPKDSSPLKPGPVSDGDVEKNDRDGKLGMADWVREKPAIADFSKERPGFQDKTSQVQTSAAPADALTYYDSGNRCYQQGDMDQAIAHYTEAIRIYPQYFEAYSNRGVARKAKKDLAGALNDYSKAVELNPQYASAYSNRANVRQAMGDMEGSLADCNKAIELEPNYANAYNIRASYRYAKGDIEGALADSTKAIELNPQYATAYYSRAVVYEYAKRDLVRALSDYNKAIQYNPTYGEAYYYRGYLYYRQSKWDLALSDYNKTISLNPATQDIYYYRGQAYHAKGAIAEALADYNKALEINPKDAKVFYARGNLLLSRNQADAAIRDYDKVVFLYPKAPDGYVARGLARQAKGELEAALLDANQALQLSPQYAPAYNLRGIVKVVKKEYSEAVKDLTRALQLNPKYADAYKHRAMAYQAQAEHKQAAADFRAYLELQPNDPQALFIRKYIEQHGQ